MNEKIKKHIIELLKRGEDIPVEFQEDLFPTTKKEYELKYAGKEKKEVILNDTMSVPFQAIKHFGDVKAGEWANMLIFGDNLQALKHLLKMKEEGNLKNADGSDGVKLIYIDPPFATKQDFKGNQEQKAYQDKIIGAKFIEFLRERLVFLRELLTDDGSIYIHLDEKKSHYIKVILDEIFGENRFQREIVWDTRVLSGFKTQAQNWIRGHDVIFFYLKGKNYAFNKVTTEHREEYIKRFNKVDKDGRKYFDGRGGKRYLDEVLKKGKPVGDVWSDIMSFQQIPTSKERLDFPTQKPEALLERIVEASSSEGDIVLDCFAGAGTTGSVCEKLKRKWIMVDCGKLAIYTMQKRLMNLKEEIGNKGKALKLKPFTLYNAGLYHDGEFLNKMQEEEYKDFVLELFGCKKRDHEINGIKFHGTLDNHSVMIFEKKHFLTHEFIEDLHKNVEKSIKDEVFLIAPVGIVGFNEDYISKDKGKVKYTILRIPNSIIDYIRQKKFTRLEQPRTADDINQTIDSVGFDFIYPPKVKSKYSKEKGKYCIEIQDFEPIQLGAKIVEFKDTKSETLAMVMVDLDYDEKTFNLDEYFFGDQITKNNYQITIQGEVGERIMVIYLDIFGNEKKEVLQKKDFKG